MLRVTLAILLAVSFACEAHAWPWRSTNRSSTGYTYTYNQNYYYNNQNYTYYYYPNTYHYPNTNESSTNTDESSTNTDESSTNTDESSTTSTTATTITGPQSVAAAKAQRMAASGLKAQHLGGGFGGANAEGVGFSAYSAQHALNSCCFTGQRYVAGSAVVRGRDGWYAVKLYW